LDPKDAAGRLERRVFGARTRGGVCRTPANRSSNKKRSADSLGGPTGDVRYESAVTARHFEARRGEAEEEGTRGDRRHG